MNQKEVKKVALDTIMESIGCAYYKITDSEEYSKVEQDKIVSQINKLGERAAKALRTRYITY